MEFLSCGIGVNVHQCPKLIPCKKLKIQEIGIKQRTHTFTIQNQNDDFFLFSPMNCPIANIIIPTAIRISSTATELGVCSCTQIIMATTKSIKLNTLPTKEKIRASLFSVVFSGIGSIPFGIEFVKMISVTFLNLMIYPPKSHLILRACISL